MFLRGRERCRRVVLSFSSAVCAMKISRPLGVAALLAARPIHKVAMKADGESAPRFNSTFRVHFLGYLRQMYSLRYSEESSCFKFTAAIADPVLYSV